MQFNNPPGEIKSMTTLYLKKPMGRSSLRLALLLIPLVFACFALSPMAQAVSPPPDGDYPGGNTAEGFKALFHLNPQDGGFNTAVGFYSLFSNTTGSFNTALGAGALDLNTGHNNTATGAAALLLNTTGSNNTAVGAGALTFNNGAQGNTAVGAGAAAQNTEGLGNTAIGAAALANNTGGFSVSSGNTAVGVAALTTTTGSIFNTAVGAFALTGNTTGSGNTAVGASSDGFNPQTSAALAKNTTGNDNTAFGEGALNNNTSGSNNTAVGNSAGSNVATADQVICIGADVGGADVSNTTWIGGVYGVTTQSGMTAPVIVSDGGQLGTVASSERFKKDIATMDKASEVILALRPVTFHYKTDTKGIPQFGLIAEEVAKVNPGLVLPDKEGKPYTVRYDQVNAMLLNEFLKARRQIDAQQKQIDALSAGLQRVSAQLELSEPASQTVLNSQ
jgi:hypothetical protein